MKLYLGIDWSESKHDICLLNPGGVVQAQTVIEHSETGFCQLDHLRKQMGVSPQECAIGLETAHSILVDFLWDRSYSAIYILPPTLVKGSRTRLRSSGARDDPSDAFLIADILRTDLGRLHCWQPDSLLTRQLRARVRFFDFLTTQIVRLTNRQRAILLRYFPAAANLFSGLNILIAQHFVLHYPTPQTANQLDLPSFRSFAKQHRYPRPNKLAGILAKLDRPYPQAPQDLVRIYQSEAQELARMLLEIIRLKRTTNTEISRLLSQHPDYQIYSSLPGTGDYLQAALLSKLGDDRQRLVSANHLQALAGTCPVTVSSGKRKFVRFRHACDRDFRRIAQQWAKSSLGNSVWANTYFSQVLPRCDSYSHAYRCLANRWLAILWRLWQDRLPYNESYHLQQRRRKSQLITH
jgi:transposase